MKFKVRDGFHMMMREFTKDEATGKQVVEETRISAGKTAEFDEYNAMRHLHMLEPIDKDAKDFVAAFMDAHRMPGQPRATA